MTEQEARQKWCPFVRTGPGGNRGDDVVRCIASDCMAWRWGCWDKHDRIDNEQGYCGLASK